MPAQSYFVVSQSTLLGLASILLAENDAFVFDVYLRSHAVQFLPTIRGLEPEGASMEQSARHFLRLCYSTAGRVTWYSTQST